MVIQHPYGKEVVREMAPVGGYAVISFFTLVIYLILIGVGIYCLVLFIKLAHRGIKALDIYIEEKDKSRLKQISVRRNRSVQK